MGPLGFTLDDKMLKRAGLDYWQYVDLAVYPDWRKFKELNVDLNNRFFFSKFGSISLKDIHFYSNSNENFQFRKNKEEIMLLFGSESKGLFTLIGEEEMKGHPIVTLPVVSF